MNLKEANELITDRTAKLGDIIRQLALAGIGIIWIFKKDVAGQAAIPRDLFRPGILIITSLALDLLQYTITSILWIAYYRIKENEFKRRKTLGRKTDTARIEELGKIEFEIPDWFNRLQYFFFWTKVFSIVIAYYFLLSYLLKNIPAI
jgi:hypothetical protein